MWCLGLGWTQIPTTAPGASWELLQLCLSVYVSSGGKSSMDPHAQVTSFLSKVESCVIHVEINPGIPRGIMITQRNSASPWTRPVSSLRPLFLIPLSSCCSSYDPYIILCRMWELLVGQYRKLNLEDFLGSCRTLSLKEAEFGALLNITMFSFSWSYWKCVDSKRKRRGRGGHLHLSRARRFLRTLGPSSSGESQYCHQNLNVSASKV